MEVRNYELGIGRGRLGVDLLERLDQTRRRNAAIPHS